MIHVYGHVFVCVCLLPCDLVHVDMCSSTECPRSPEYDLGSYVYLT